ncbi:MAG: DNA repair protein RecO, partial [Proteobacteria bacterium]
MAVTFEDTAIVLRVVPYEDRHRIVTALSESRGKISAMANNAVNSRRFGSALQPFAASTWRMAERNGSQLLRLDEAVLKRGFEGIRKHFEILTIASVLNDMILRVAPENEAVTELFKLHSNALALLEDWANEAETLDPIRYFQVLNGYFSKLLQWNGTQPQLMRCL